jgi:hypothetical protein
MFSRADLDLDRYVAQATPTISAAIMEVQDDDSPIVLLVTGVMLAEKDMIATPRVQRNPTASKALSSLSAD